MQVIIGLVSDAETLVGCDGSAERFSTRDVAQLPIYNLTPNWCKKHNSTGYKDKNMDGEGKRCVDVGALKRPEEADRRRTKRSKLIASDA